MTSTKSRISESGILRTSLAAMMKAGRSYKRWTNGYFAPWRGPEYIYTTTVAQEIAKQPYSPRVYCEYRSKYAKSEANLAGHGFPNRELTALSRTDILIAGKDDFPRHAIEVKRRVWTTTQVQKDIHRLADFVPSENAISIRSGICLFFLCYDASTRSEAKEKLENKLEENLARSVTDRRAFERDDPGFLITGVRKTLKRRKNYRVSLLKGNEIAIYESEYEPKSWAWTSVALVVKPPRSE